MDLDLFHGQSLNQDLFKSSASSSSSVLSRSSQVVPLDKDSYFFYNYEEFNATMKEIGTTRATLQMIRSSKHICDREMVYLEDTNDKYDWVVDGNDEA